jgi:hypothetical protein
MPPRYCRPELVAAPSSSSAGQEWGRGGDPLEMGQGEEIRWRWSRGGDPLEMGQGKDNHRSVGCPEVEARWLALGKEDNTYFFLFFPFFIFYCADKWPLSMSAQIKFSLPAHHLQVGPIYQIRCKFAFNSRLVRIAKNYPKSHGFLELKRKVVVFQNFAFNVVVLC